MHILAGNMQPDSGSVHVVDGVKIVYFDQEREKLDQALTLKNALSPDSDSVIYRDRPVHVVTWAKRFLFKPDQLDMPVSKLSGGEQARVLIANLMLEPADILILDEPTNDLDIPSLEILESSLEEFPGAVILSTHDRYILDKIATSVIGFDGNGNADTARGLDQWLEIVNSRRESNEKKPAKEVIKPDKTKKNTTGKLTYKLRFELESIEEKILEAEQKENELQLLLEQSDILNNPVKLEETCTLLNSAQKEVQALYSRWEELESMKDN
jgi:ATP-binding cassette subfamily F protein uup